MSVDSVLPKYDGQICVRKLTYADAEGFSQGSDDEAVKLYGHLPLEEYTPQVVRQQIDGVIADGLRDGSLAVLAIADAVTDEFLGSVVLFNVRQNCAEVGFWLAWWARGRGAAQAALRVISWIAAETGLTVLEAKTVPENRASRRVLEGAGFRQVAGPTTETTPSGYQASVLTFECPVPSD